MTTKFKLRDHQIKCLSAMHEAFIKKKTTNRGAIVLPTGSGKTFTAAYFNIELVKKTTATIVWVAHRDELIQQAIDSHVNLKEDLDYSLWTAKEKNATGRIIFTSVQSSKGLADTLSVLLKDKQKCVVLVIDECHHFAAEVQGYSNLYAKLEKALFASNLAAFSYGLTASPERMDGRPLGYDKIIYQMQFFEAVRLGFLAKPLYYEMKSNQQFHLDSVENDQGKRDYTDQDLKKLDNPVRNRAIAKEIVTHLSWKKNGKGEFILKDGNKVHGWGKTIVFGINVAHCYNIAAEIKKIDQGIDVRVIDGTATKEEREEFKTWLAEGDRHSPKVAINCLIFTEGFDEPSLNTVFITRPTKSQSLWVQMAGRGARPIFVNGVMSKATFNLVCVMDEIGHYGSLVRDWTLDVLDPDNDKLSYSRNKAKKKRRKKRKLINRLLKEESVSHTDLEEATLIDVESILIASTQYSYPMGIPLDRDRKDCIRLLQVYAKKCLTIRKKGGKEIVELDIDAYKNSYSHCVPAGEFDHITWRVIIWAYYLRYFCHKTKVRNNLTGKNQTTFKLINILDKSEAREDPSQIKNRIDTTRKESEEKNEMFNTKYGDRKSSSALYRKITNKMAADGLSDKVLFLTEYAKTIKVKDRRVEVLTSFVITNSNSQKDKDALNTINALNKAGTRIMQNLLQDSVCEFIVKPIVK